MKHVEYLQRRSHKDWLPNVCGELALLNNTFSLGFLFYFPTKYFSIWHITCLIHSYLYYCISVVTFIFGVAVYALQSHYESKINLLKYCLHAYLYNLHSVMLCHSNTYAKLNKVYRRQHFRLIQIKIFASLIYFFENPSILSKVSFYHMQAWITWTVCTKWKNIPELATSCNLSQQ